MVKCWKCIDGLSRELTECTLAKLVLKANEDSMEQTASSIIVRYSGAWKTVLPSLSQFSTLLQHRISLIELSDAGHVGVCSFAADICWVLCAQSCSHERCFRVVSSCTQCPLSISLPICSDSSCMLTLQLQAFRSAAYSSPASQPYMAREPYSRHGPASLVIHTSWMPMSIESG